MSLQTFGNYRACKRCTAHDEQTWIDTTPGGLHEGHCTDCANSDRLTLDQERNMLPSAPLVPATEIPVIQAEGTRAAGQLKAIEGFTITTPEHRAMLANALQEIKGAYKRLHDRQLLITRPALASVESTREFFRPVLQHFLELEKTIKRKLAEYEERTARDQIAAQDRAQELANAGDFAGAANALATITAPAGPTAGISVRRPWKFRVRSLDLVPLEFLLPNVKEIDAEMRKQLAERPNESPTIAGIEFYQEVEIAARAK